MRFNDLFQIKFGDLKIIPDNLLHGRQGSKANQLTLCNRNPISGCFKAGGFHYTVE